MTFCVAAAVCGRALSWIITTPRLSMPRRLFCIARRNFFKSVAIIVEPWGNKSTSRTPFLSQNTVHMIFRVEVVCLNFVFVGDKVCLHSMDCCFDSGVAWDTHVSSPVTTRHKKLSSSSLYPVRKSNALACRFNLCSSVSIFGTQRAHNFRNLRFIRHNFVKKWPWNLRKMQGKWRNGESSVLSNLLFNCSHQIFIHHRRSAAPRIIMHIFASFVKYSHPSPYHLTTHGMFSIHVTKLTMNFSRFHVLRIQETDYRPHFTCGGILYFS